MAESVKFPGFNRIYAAPQEEGDELPYCEPMHALNNGAISITCWKPTKEEMDEIVQTGEIWMANRTGKRAMQPHWIGSESEIKRHSLDFAGGRWFRWPPPEPVSE